MDQQETNVNSIVARSEVETAQRMLELIHDLGECLDGRQILVAALRHYRFLFGDYKGMALLLNNPKSDSWRSVVMENPYGQSWGGLNHNQLPERTDIDQIGAELGHDATAWITNEGPFRRALVDSKASFVADGSALAVRLGMFTGLEADVYWVGSWQLPGGGHAWSVLGFMRAHVPDEKLFSLYCTAVETTSRMAYYPSLLQSVARTERINQSIRRNIVHDLKTPITVIKGYADTLALEGMREDAEMFEELVTGIEESCQRLLSDIKDIIEPIEGAWSPQKEEFDLSLMLQKVVLAERHTERSRGHELLVEGCDTPVMVCADRRKLMRVVENLLSNAVKYSPGAGKKVWTRLRVAGELIGIEVQDQGFGLSADQIQRVLNDCERVVDESLGIEGSGFGLNSCQFVLRAHGGQLQVESDVGAGSVFRAVVKR
ncbi:MAG: sensor histidine kinase [Fimbriimonadaceae bacterium]